MKTIVITISRGSIAKNILGTDFYEYLRTRFRLVILTQAHQDPRFLNAFAREGVIIAPLPDFGRSMYEEVLFFFHKYLAYNSSVNQKSRWGVIGHPGSRTPIYAIYLLKKIIFVPLSKVRALRTFVRYIDKVTTQHADVASFKSLLQEYEAAMVVVTHVADDGEIALIKAANELGVTSVAFPKSWDNLSKHGFRAKADYLIVWNEFMKQQALDFQDYAPERVLVVGVPQYDFNFRKDMNLSREEWCNIYGLNPARKVILLGSEGKLFPSDAVVAKMIHSFMQNKELAEDAQLLIRPHYGYKNDDKKFSELDGLPDVVIDRFNDPSKDFRDEWDYSDAFTSRFVNCMRHADIVVNTASTLTADAMCFEVPVINTAIDAEEQPAYNQSVERWYETHYYQKILSYRASRLVRSKAELLAALNTYLSHPETDREARIRLKEEFTYKHDGRSGVRFAEALESIIR